jgi:hypothetical protein
METELALLKQRADQADQRIASRPEAPAPAAPAAPVILQLPPWPTTSPAPTPPLERPLN